MMLKVFVVIVALAFELIQLNTSVENITEVDNDNERKFENETCVDELSTESCAAFIQQENCNVNHVDTWKCRKSCQLCNSAERVGGDATTCKDLLPGCEVMVNPQICCKFKEIANETCKKACLFCYDMPEMPGIDTSMLPGIQAIPNHPKPPPPNPCPPGASQIPMGG